MKTKSHLTLIVLNVFSLFNLQISYCQLANSPWPMKGHDYRLSNSSPTCGPNVPRLKWRKDFTGQYLGGMAIGPDGNLYVNAHSSVENRVGADSLGYVYSFEPNGNLKWTFTIYDGTPVNMSPAIGINNTIYVHVDGNEGNFAAPEKLYAINANGTQQWKYSPGSAVFTGAGSCPSIWDDGTIFFGSNGCVLFRMNADGSINNIYNSPSTSSINETVPLGVNGRFFLERKVFSFNGDYLWSTPPDIFHVNPEKDSTVYCVNGGYNGEGHDSLSIYKHDGSIKKQISLPWGHDSYLVAMNDSFMVFTKAPYGDSTSIFIMAKDGSHYSKCSKKWFWTTDLSIVIDSSNVVYVLQSWWESSRIYAFNSNGTEKWHFDLPAPGTASYEFPAKLIIGQDRTIYITISSAFSSNTYIYAIGDMPIISSTTDGSRCGIGTVNLGATASAGIINWYSSSTGGTSLGTGTSFTTPSLTSKTRYYVDATNNGCTTATRTAVTATITAIPTITGTTDGSHCGTVTVTLSATASAGIINWYSSSTGGTSLGTGTRFTTPSLTSTTVYYVDATNNGCTTATRTAVTAKDTCPTSVNSITSSNKIKIYPNPTTGMFEISINDPNNSVDKIELFNNLGSIIKTISVVKNENNIQLDLSRYPEGLYLIKLETKKGIFQYKIIKK
jgi:hypothetical protein